MLNQFSENLRLSVSLKLFSAETLLALSTVTVEVGIAEMNVHTIATLFIVIGLVFALSCVVQAEICYRQVKRYLEHNRETRDRAATRYRSTEREG